jgi:cysteine sulfinate desulfinase/cysteine desulfurase-like protein
VLAKIALEDARGQVATLLGCGADEVVLTSGGSEANNLALKGVFFALKAKGGHIVTSEVEIPPFLVPAASSSGSPRSAICRSTALAVSTPTRCGAQLRRAPS